MRLTYGCSVVRPSHRTRAATLSESVRLITYYRLKWQNRLTDRNSELCVNMYLECWTLIYLACVLKTHIVYSIQWSPWTCINTDITMSWKASAPRTYCMYKRWTRCFHKISAKFNKVEIWCLWRRTLFFFFTSEPNADMGGVILQDTKWSFRWRYLFTVFSSECKNVWGTHCQKGNTSNPNVLMSAETWSRFV